METVSFKICPFVQCVTTLFECKGTAYDIEYIDLSSKPGWFLEAFLNGQVSDDFEDRFSTFYLADTTYLGQLTTVKNGVSCVGERECAVEYTPCCA